MLVELMMIAPPECRPVFEDYLDKTYDQVLREKFASPSPAGGSEVWGTAPEAHVNDIYRALQERCRWIWAEARKPNAKAAQALDRLRHQALYEAKQLREATRGG